MKRKSLLSFRIASFMLVIVSLLSLVLTQTGCMEGKQENKEGVVKSSPDSAAMIDWIAMEIKFKPNANAEMRDMAIREIKKIIADSVLVMRKAGYFGFSPTIMISNSLVGDSLTYKVYVRSPGKGPISGGGDTLYITPPKCTDPCKTGCGVCSMVVSRVANPVPPSPFDYIQTITSPEK